MSSTTFDRDEMARWYAAQHVKVDSEIVDIHYLPTGAPDREIRLVEVDRGEHPRTDARIEPIDFGFDRDKPTQHVLSVLDVTPPQWKRILAGRLALPHGWSLDGMRVLAEERRLVRRPKTAVGRGS
jgi:hypothetical protein